MASNFTDVKTKDMTKEDFIEILDKYDSTFNLETGETIQAIYFQDFSKLAGELVKLFAIHNVIKSSPDSDEIMIMNSTDESTAYLFEDASDPIIEREVEVIMDLYNVFEVTYSEWPKKVRKICKKRGNLSKLTIKDLLKIEQILGCNILKIEKQ